MKFNLSTLPIITIVNSIKNMRRNGLDLHPIYKKEYIWNNDFKENLIYSLIKNYPIGNIIIRNLNVSNYKNAKSEVIDGQQRLTTIYQFINNGITLSGEISKKIIEENIDYFEEESDTNKEVAKILKRFQQNKKIYLTYSKLPIDLKNNIESFPLSLTFISDISLEEASLYYKFIQAQEKLKAKELNQTFPDTYLEKYLDKLENRENLLKILNFKNEKIEFEKIFYSIFGILENKIKLGCADENIQKYARDKKEDLKGKQQQQIEKMITNLNTISKLSIECLEIKFNKRYLKLLLLLCSLGNLDFKKNGKNILLDLKIINDKLSAFNSYKPDILKKAFLKESEKKIEDYRKLSFLMKGSQKLETVEERIKFLEIELKHGGVNYGN